MSVDALALGLVAIEDEEVRSAVAGGDFASLEDSDLSDEESALLKDAAAENPEVEGFDFSNSARYRAVDYARVNQDRMSPTVRSNFSANIQKNYGGSGGGAAYQSGDSNNCARG